MLERQSESGKAEGFFYIFAETQDGHGLMVLASRYWQSATALARMLRLLVLTSVVSHFWANIRTKEVLTSAVGINWDAHQYILQSRTDTDVEALNGVIATGK